MEKSELLQKMQEKGMSVAGIAEAIGFDAQLLSLYLVNDSYPVPTRIMKKLAEAIAS